jgi:hypothetical protein
MQEVEKCTTKKEHEYVSDFQYSPDGKSFAYIATQDAEEFIVKD